ncbi:unannotated protein [freshwater metagenome]|uniref:Unannotated protein n=1 Tax=freshwater metagenome TaxID=449393 RepID=A0A6J7FBT3_9ZZZZ
MGCSELFGSSNLVVGNVNCNDRASSAHTSALNRIQANSTRSNNNDMATSRNFCCIGYCTKTCDDTTCKKRCTCHRNCFRHCNALRLMHEHKFCKATSSHALHNRVAFCIGDWRLGIERKLSATCNWVTHAATMAVSARANQRDNNMLTNFYCGDIGTDFFNDSGALMPVDGWQCAAPRTLCIGDVAVTNCNSRNFDANFARTCIGKLNIFNH